VSLCIFFLLAGLGVRPALAAQTVVVVLDDSGSMRTQLRMGNAWVPRIEAAKQTLSKVISELPADSQIGILLLNGGKKNRGDRWLVPLGPLNTASTLQKIKRINADGGTPLGASMKTAADALLEARDRSIYGSFRMLVVTDGEASDPDLLANYLPDLLSRGLTLDVIGVDMAGEHSLAQRSHSYRRAANAEDFEKALREIFAESGSTDDLSGSSSKQEDDFSIIAGLPDEPDLSRKILATLAVPNNQELHPVSAKNADVLPQVTPPASLPMNVPRPPGGTSISLTAIFALVPCCASVLIFMVVLVAIIQALNKNKHR
jgi:uncharacterized protein YegL